MGCAGKNRCRERGQEKKGISDAPHLEYPMIGIGIFHVVKFVKRFSCSSKNHNF